MRSRLGTRRAALATITAAALLVAALTGCGAMNKSGGSSGTSDAGPPAGGWPQAANGKLTTQMCGLLTDADYRKFGHDRMQAEEPRLDAGGHRVDCLYMLEDSLTLDLQPTAEVAKKLFDSQQVSAAEHVKEAHVTSEFVAGVVPGTDQSWYDISNLSTGDGADDVKEHELHLRRGSLLVTLLQGGLKGKNETDPKTMLAGLANLVLARVPDLGKTDTGRAHVLHYVLNGKGKAETISYTDPAKADSVKLTNQKLPWHLDITIPSTGSQMVLFNLTASATTSAGFGLLPALACSISVDTDQIDQNDGNGLAFCTGSYTEAKN